MAHTGDMTPLDVADWRRRVFALYEQVRERLRMLGAAHELWREGRDELFVAPRGNRPHAEDRPPGIHRPPVADYDPAWRFEVEVEPAESGSTSTSRPERMGSCRSS